jgi:hypothetical protein
MAHSSENFYESALTGGTFAAQRGERVFWARHFLLVASGVALILSAVRAVRGIGELSSIAVNHVSGAWAALALDFAHGELYRPVISDIGYGGTRYFPLQFVLHGLLIRLGLSPLVAGHALSIAALAALICGAYALLRCLRVSAAFAGPGAILLLANPPVQGALLTIRGDLLACALNVCGLALGMSDERRRLRWVAPILFSLAILTKQTAIYGVVAMAVALAVRGDRKRALGLAAAVISLVAIGVAATQLASGGTFLALMRACSSGGATLKSIALAPIHMFNFAFPADLALVVLGLAGVIAVDRSALLELPGLYLIATACITTVLFGSPGVDENHFLDLDVAVVLFLVPAAAKGRLKGAFAPLALALAALQFCGSVALTRVVPQRPVVSQVLEEVGTSGGPLLAENPWLAILAGERPYLLDAFTFKLIADRDPRVREDLLRKLDARFFRAVVLKNDLFDSFVYKDWYREVHFGPGFSERLLDNYELVAQHSDQFYVYRPRAR